MSHWHPKDRKEYIAQDIREFVQRDDPTAEMRSLINMTAVDLTALSLALRRAPAAASDEIHARDQHEIQTLRRRYDNLERVARAAGILGEPS